MCYPLHLLPLGMERLPLIRSVTHCRGATCACTSYDLVIICGVLSGLTAVVYAATLKMEALLVAKELGGQAVDSTEIENYLWFDFVTGPELVDKFKHLLGFNYIDHLMRKVEKIEPREGGFRITTSELAA